MATLYLYAQFTSQKAGIATLDDVTIDIDRVDKSTGAVDALVTDGTVTTSGNLSSLRNGIYRYGIANVDVQNYDYLGTFKTASTDVDLKHVPSLRHEYVDTLNVDDGKVLLQDAQIDDIATLENQTEISSTLDSINDMFTPHAPGPVIVIPAFPDPDIAVVYVRTRTEAGVKNNVEVLCKLLDALPIVVDGGYECSPIATKKSGQSDDEFPDDTPADGLVFFALYPGKKYETTCERAGLRKTFIALAAGTTTNIDDLADYVAP